MSANKQSWFAVSFPNGTVLRCAACAQDIDLRFPTADHHPRVCPACGAESAFLNWKGRTLQVVMDHAPRPLVDAIRWAQQHLDELEYVELVCALEEIAGAMTEDSRVSAPAIRVQPGPC